MDRVTPKWAGVGGMNTCAEEAPSLSEEELRSFFEGFFEQAPYGLALTNLNGDILRANPALQTMLGFGEGDLCGRHFSSITYPDDLEQNQELYEKLIAGDVKYYQLEKRYVHADGRRVPGMLTVSCVADEAGAPKYLIAMVESLEARMQQEARVHHLINEDALTGLSNRTGFMSRLREIVGIAARSDGWALLILLDLDRFKAINESLGHERGDQLLKAVASRLVEAAPEGSELGRLGGDEFVLIMGGASDGHEAEPTAVLVLQRFIDVLSRPFYIGRREVFLSASMGVALFPQDASMPNVLVRNAESAMYHAKSERRRAFAFFSSHMNSAAEERLTLESELRAALREGALELYYQPQLELESSRVIGVEALVRWKHSNRGLVLPPRFVPMAEESGIVVDLDQWVVREGTRTLRRWRDDGLPPVRMAINLSAITFRESDPVKLLDRAIVEAGVDASSVEVEITETSMMEQTDRSVAIVRAMKGLGLSVALDDFGTGYSSLSYLHRFPIDRIKIDQSFVRHLDTNSDDATIVAAIVNLGHGLGLEVIAEGVEAEAQLEFLKMHRCDVAQGFLLGRPMPLADVQSLLER